MQKYLLNDSDEAPFSMGWLATNFDLKTHLVKRTKLNDINNYEIEFINLEAAEDFKDTLEKRGLANIRLWDFNNTIELYEHSKDKFLSVAQNTSPLDQTIKINHSQKQENISSRPNSLFPSMCVKEKLKTPFFTTIDDINRQIEVINKTQNFADNLTAWVNLFLLGQKTALAFEKFYESARINTTIECQSEKHIFYSIMRNLRGNITTLNSNLTDFNDWEFLNEIYTDRERKLVLQFLNLVKDISNEPSILRDLDMLLKAYSTATSSNPYVLNNNFTLS